MRNKRDDVMIDSTDIKGIKEHYMQLYASKFDYRDETDIFSEGEKLDRKHIT